MFRKFPSIEGFHNVKKSIAKTDAHPNCIYSAKVKIHGTNAGVTIMPNGKVYAQSRNRIITPDDDNMGFAHWVENTKNYWTQLRWRKCPITVFGEWFGEGIMKSTSASQVPGKHFAVFAIMNEFNMFSSDTDSWVKGIIFNEKYKNIPENLHVIPKLVVNGQLQININFNSDESVDYAVNVLNKAIEDIERCDPFIYETFGIDGPGEGIVLTPVGTPLIEDYSLYSFKVKGEKHKNVKQKKPVQIDPEKAASIDEFVDNVLTTARLEQGMYETVGNLDFDKKNLGGFLKWIGQDVQKECRDELEASGLEWKDVVKSLQNTARNWFLENSNER